MFTAKAQGGHIVVPDVPGTGFERKSDPTRAMRELAE
jgi:hypothetical protein